MMKTLRLFLILLMTALIIVACGGGDDDSSDTTDTDDTAETTEITDNTSQADDETEADEESDVTFELIEFEPTATFGTGQILSMALAPDDSQLAIGTGVGTVFLFEGADLTTEPTVINLGAGRFEDIAYSPDGSQLAIANYFGSVHVIDTASGDIIWEGFPQRTASDDGAIVIAIFEAELTPVRVAFSPDGATLAVAYDDSGNVNLFDAGTGENGRLLDGRTPITNIPEIAFTSDSSQLVASHGNGDVDVFDVASGELVVRREDDFTTNALAISPDGSTVATVNTQSGPRFLTLVNASDLTTAQEIQNDNLGDALIYSVDGGSIITTTGRSNNGTVLAYDVATLTEGASFTTNLPVNDLAMNSDGSVLYISDTANVYAIDATALLAGDADTEIEEPLSTFASNDFIMGVDYNADRSQVIICERNGTATIFDVATGESLQSIWLPPVNTNGCSSIRFTEDENVIIVRRGTQGYAYNLETEETLFTYRPSNGGGISDNGMYALGMFSSNFTIFDFSDTPTDGSLVQATFEIDLEAFNIIRATSGRQLINPDGTRAVTLTSVEGGTSALILDPTSGEALIQIPVWENRVSDISLSDDGSTFVLAGYEDLGLDGDRIIIHIYDITGEEATISAEIPLSDPNNEDLRVRSIAVSHNGGLIAIMANDGIMHLWDRETEEIVASFFVGLNFNTLTFEANSPLLFGYDGNNFITTDPNLYGVVMVWDLSEYVGEMDMPESEEAQEADDVEMTEEPESTPEATEESE